MKLLIVAVRDRAADAFMRPFFVPTRGMAIRSFQDEVNRAAPDNSMNAHPEDYDLFALGTFDEETGQFTGNQTGQPEQIAIGKDSLIAKK